MFLYLRSAAYYTARIFLQELCAKYRHWLQGVSVKAEGVRAEGMSKMEVKEEA